MKKKIVFRASSCNDDEIDFSKERPAPMAPRNLNHYLDLLSQPRETDNTQPKINSLPVEGKSIKIFISK